MKTAKPDSFKYHTFSHVRISLPIVIGQAGHMAASIADTLMVGSLGSTALAAVSFSNSINIIFFIFGIGALSGVTTLVSRALGENNKKAIDQLFIAGVLFSLAISSVIFILNATIYYLFDYMQQEPEVIAEARMYYIYLILSTIPYLIFANMKHFIEGFALTKPGMFMILIANLLNILGNYVFIFGKFGFPALGTEGAGLSTFLSRVLMLLFMVVYLYTNKRFRGYLISMKTVRMRWSKLLDLLKLGAPIGLQWVLEITVFSVAAILIGTFGSNYFAAHQIAMNIASLTFMLAHGISSAATIRVSYYRGRREYLNILRASEVSYVLATSVMLIFGIAIYFLRGYIPSIFISDTNVQALTIPILLIVALFQIFDGIQVVSLGILRGLEDVNKPTLFTMITYWIVMLPACYFFGVWLDYKASGVWFGFMVGIFTAAILQTARFYYFTRKRLNFE